MLLFCLREVRSVRIHCGPALLYLIRYNCICLDLFGFGQDSAYMLHNCVVYD